MTTDPFTEAAQDEAVKRWPHLPHRPETHVLNVGKRVGFDLGASWARTHLAVQGPTDTDQTPLQERIARDIASADGVGGPDGAFLYSHYAAAVLPRIAAEVRKAQADALRDAAEALGEWGGEAVVVTGDAYDEDTWVETSVTEWLTARATDIEKED